ncbi:hypothetical protein CUR178_06923 [Leishmania enriettii]|uniref:Uncharacterized protein n=1 Tax=Leishmania enriettii TaxID=5663 RepID=A0A836HTG8_LEIEN|nr:hypothetical protein CUR178_06923 [Leishmania enriettii]
MPTTPTSGRAAGTETATSSRHGVSESCPARRDPSMYQLTTAAVLALKARGLCWTGVVTGPAKGAELVPTAGSATTEEVSSLRVSRPAS